MKYVLFIDSVEKTTIEIIRFLDFLDVEAKPALCVEKNYPPTVTTLPSIFDIQSKEWFVGLPSCIDFYQSKTGFRNILYFARKFNQEFEEY